MSIPLAQRGKRQPLAELYLDYLLKEWRALPSVAKQWNDWDELDRLDFVIEWPIRTDRLLQLHDFDAAGVLTADQQRRYAELLALIEQHQPLLDTLLQGLTATDGAG